MNSKKKLYEGKAKILYKGPDPDTLIQYFKDDATAFNNKKKAQIHFQKFYYKVFPLLRF